MPSTTIGNGMGTLLGFVKSDGRFRVLGPAQAADGSIDTTTRRHYIADAAAKMDQASVLHLSCSAARGSVLSDGSAGQQVIASIAVKAGAGHHVTYEPTVPIECETNLAGFSTDEISVSLKDTLGQNIELGGEAYTTTLVISWHE